MSEPELEGSRRLQSLQWDKREGKTVCPSHSLPRETEKTFSKILQKDLQKWHLLRWNDTRRDTGIWKEKVGQTKIATHVIENLKSMKESANIWEGKKWKRKTNYWRLQTAQSLAVHLSTKSIDTSYWRAGWDVILYLMSRHAECLCSTVS